MVGYPNKKERDSVFNFDVNEIRTTERSLKPFLNHPEVVTSVDYIVRDDGEIRAIVLNAQVGNSKPVVLKLFYPDDVLYNFAKTFDETKPSEMPRQWYRNPGHGQQGFAVEQGSVWYLGDEQIKIIDTWPERECASYTSGDNLTVLSVTWDFLNVFCVLEGN